MAEPDRVDRKRLMQVALNEAALRQVNERIYGPGKSGSGLPQFPIVCECGAASCEIALTVDATLYSSVRADPHRFLVKSGHEIPEAETVVVRHGDIATIDRLVSAGANINEPSGVNGWPPVVHAIHTRQRQAVLKLLERGASLEGSAGRDGLFMASGYGDAETVSILL